MNILSQLKCEEGIGHTGAGRRIVGGFGESHEPRRSGSYQKVCHTSSEGARMRVQ
jgi:hypothetical protein